jgi:lipoic acid synthetase
VVKDLGLDHIVVTSVNRDDLPDGGSTHFAKTVFWIKNFNPRIRVEVLIPDFKGDQRALETVVRSGINVLNHNIETLLPAFAGHPKGRQRDTGRNLNQVGIDAWCG